MAEEPVRIYGEGPNRDEGGNHTVETREVPTWYAKARQVCVGCHDNFYNGRANCTGKSYCFSLQAKFARRKTRPGCWH